MLVYIKWLIPNNIHYTRCKWNFSNSSAVQNSVKVFWDRNCIWRHVGDLTHRYVFMWNFAATLSAKISLASTAKRTNPAFSKKKQNHWQKSQKITVNTSHIHIPPASQQEFGLPNQLQDSGRLGHGGLQLAFQLSHQIFTLKSFTKLRNIPTLNVEGCRV